MVLLAASVIVVARKDGLFRSWGPHWKTKQLQANATIRLTPSLILLIDPRPFNPSAFLLYIVTVMMNTVAFWTDLFSVLLLNQKELVNLEEHISLKDLK